MKLPPSMSFASGLSPLTSLSRSSLSHQLSSFTFLRPRVLHSRSCRFKGFPRNRMDSSDFSGLPSAAPAVGASPSRKRDSQPRKKLRFGQTHVIQPKGNHQATVIWMHGLGDVGASWAEVLETLPLYNIKWIVPTAPVQPVAVMGGFPCSAWFDVGALSEDAPDDLEGLDASAAHIAELLSNEPSNIKLGIGGFSQGAATALYTTTCSVAGKYSDGTSFPLKFSFAAAISGWLPCAKNLKSRLDENTRALQQARELPLFLGHGTVDNIVLYKYGEKSAAALQAVGFSSLTFKSYKGLGHFTSPEEMNDICNFFKDKLQLHD